jgi:hypothetical protein
VAGARSLPIALGRLLVASGLATVACLAMSATARAGDGEVTLPGNLPGAEEPSVPVGEVVPIVTEPAQPFVDGVEHVAAPAAPIIAPVVPDPVDTVDPVGETAPLLEPVVGATQPIVDVTPQLPAPRVAPPTAEALDADTWPTRPSAPALIDLAAADAPDSVQSAPPTAASSHASAPADDLPTPSTPPGEAWSPGDFAAQWRIAVAGAADAGATVDEAGTALPGTTALMTILLLGVVRAGWSVLRAIAERPFSLPTLIPVPPG